MRRDMYNNNKNNHKNNKLCLNHFLINRNTKFQL